MREIVEEFENIFTQITTEKFLGMQALGGEIPFFIYPYDVSFENTVQKEILRLEKRVKESSLSVLNINIYQIMIDILESRGMLEKVLDKEQSMKKDKLLNSLTNILDVQENIVPYIMNIYNGLKDIDMVFITGISDVYPIIRSHSILNNLQSAIEDKPILMFFPGVYDGHRLRLFDKLTDDNYYRAFNIKSYQF
jgi:hypothetical protein